VDVPRAVVETGEHEIRVIGGVTRLGIVHQPIPEPVLQDIKAALATEQDFFLLTQALDLADVLVPLVSDLIGVIPGGDCAKGAAKSIIASLASTIATLVELYPQAATATTGETAQALLADVVQKAVGGATEAAESAVIGCAAEVIPVVQVLDAIASIGSVFATVVDVGAGAYDSAQNPAWATVVLPLAISLPSDTGTLEDVCPTGSPVWVALATTVGDASGYLEAWVNALDAGETAAACVGDGFAEARDYRGDILHLQADGRLTVATCWPPSAATVRRLDETLIRAGRAYGYANAAVPAATLADVLAHPTAMFAPEPAQLQRVWFEGASRCAQQTGILTVPAEYASLSLVGISASRQSDDYNLFANQFRIGSVDFPPVHTGCAVGPHWLQGAIPLAQVGAIPWGSMCSVRPPTMDA
jgi:hypothetical protein